MEKSTGRKTRQLEVVWDEVAGDNSHPTADQIYKRVRRHIPNISLGTVYRDLPWDASCRRQPRPTQLQAAWSFCRCFSPWDVLRLDIFREGAPGFRCKLCSARARQAPLHHNVLVAW